MENKTRISLLFSFLIFFCSCSPQTSGFSHIVGEIISEGPPETRDLQLTTETVPNCGGGNSTIVKHPSMTVLTTHSIEWEVGGQVGVGATIGKGVIPGGVDLSGILGNSVSQSNENGLQRSTGWDLPAEPGTIMEYSLMWREIWQHGYVNITLDDKQVKKVNLVYRTGVQSDVVSQKKLYCNSGQAVSTLEELRTNSSCAFIYIDKLEQLKTIRDVAQAIKKAEEFANFRQNDYIKGEMVPSGVLIATDLRSTNLEQYGVTPIKNQGGWGLFITTREFNAPNDGTYWCLK